MKLLVKLRPCLFLDEWSSKVSGHRRTRNAEPAIPSSSGLSRFDVELSPWNTAQSLRTSDDVAQLLVSCGIAHDGYANLELTQIHNASVT